MTTSTEPLIPSPLAESARELDAKREQHQDSRIKKWLKSLVFGAAERDECSLCGEALFGGSQMTFLPCGHCLHTPCIEGYYAYHPFEARCPYRCSMEVPLHMRQDMIKRAAAREAKAKRNATKPLRPFDAKIRTSSQRRLEESFLGRRG